MSALTQEAARAQHASKDDDEALLLEEYGWDYETATPLDPMIRFLLATPPEPNYIGAFWGVLHKPLAVAIDSALAQFNALTIFYGLRNSATRIQAALITDYGLDLDQAASRAVIGWQLAARALQDAESLLGAQLGVAKTEEEWCVLPFSRLHYWAIFLACEALEKDFNEVPDSFLLDAAQARTNAERVRRELSTDPGPLIDLGTKVLTPFLWIASAERDATSAT